MLSFFLSIRDDVFSAWHKFYGDNILQFASDGYNTFAISYL